MKDETKMGCIISCVLICIISLTIFCAWGYRNTQTFSINGYISYGEQRDTQVSFKIGDQVLSYSIKSALVLKDIENAEIPLTIIRDRYAIGRWPETRDSKQFLIYIETNLYIKPHLIGKYDMFDSKEGIYLSLYAVANQLIKFSVTDIRDIEFDKYASPEVQKQILGLNQMGIRNVENKKPKKVIEYDA